MDPVSAPSAPVPPRGAAHPLRRIALVVGLSLATAAVLLVAAELVARAVTARPPVVAVRHPFLGMIRPANLRLEKLDPETGQKFWLETDALGFRGRSLQAAEKPPGTYRIFFLGASTTENADLPEDATFPAVVEQRLNEKLHGSPRVQVGNAGTQGATSTTSLAEVAHRILELSPDLVVVMDATSSDMADSLRDDWDPAGLSLAHEPRVPRFKEWLLLQSRLLGLWEHRYGGPENPDPRVLAAKRLAARKRSPILEPTFDPCRGVGRFARNQRRLVRLCKAEGVAVALMTQATLLKPELSPEEDARIWATLVPGTDYNLRPATLLHVVETYNDSIRKTAADEGALLVDLGKKVPREAANFLDDFHLTGRGNAAIADAVLETILATGELPRGRR